MAAAHIARALLAVLFCVAKGVTAHGGSLHPWDWTDAEHKNMTRVLLATSNKFAFYNASQSSVYLPGALPVWHTAAAPANISGVIQVWEYLDASCRETAALSVKLLLQTNNTPIANTTVYVWGMTGSCANGTLDIYRNNATLGNTRGNMLWAGRESETDVTGLLFGTAPNIFFPRKVADANGPALNSLLLATDPDASPLMCADLTWAPYDAAAWAQKVAACKPSGSP